MRGEELGEGICSVEVESWRVENDELFGLLVRSAVVNSSEERVRDPFNRLEAGVELSDTT